jgi:hypothetical protein
LAEFNTAANKALVAATTKIITGSWQVVCRTREGGRREGGEEEEGVGCIGGGVYSRGREM